MTSAPPLSPPSDATRAGVLNEPTQASDFIHASPTVEQLLISYPNPHPSSASTKPPTNATAPLSSSHPFSPLPTLPSPSPITKLEPVTPSPQSQRVFGAPFVTAGGIVLLFSLVVGLMEIALFVLIMRF